MSKVLSVIIIFSLLQCYVDKAQIYYSNKINTLGIFIDSSMFLINDKDWIGNEFIIGKGNSAVIVEPTNIRLLDDCLDIKIKPITIYKHQNYVEITSSTDCLNKNLFDNKKSVKLNKFKQYTNWDSIRISSEYCRSSRVFYFKESSHKKSQAESKFGKNYPFSVYEEISILMATKGKLIYHPEFSDKSHATPFTLQIYSNGRLLDSFEYDINFNPWLNSTTGLLMEFCNPEFN